MKNLNIVLLACCLLFMSVIIVKAEEQIPIVLTKNGQSDIFETFFVANWDASARENSVTQISAKNLKALTGLFLSDEPLAIPPDRIELPQIEFKDMDNDGSYEILATEGDGCSGCPNAILIFKKAEDRIRLDYFPTENGDLKTDVIDLDGNGEFEVIANSELAASNDHASAVTWVDIYSWDGGRYVESSENFPGYYTGEYIPKLEKRLAKEEEVDANKLAQDYGWQVKRARTWKENVVSDVTLAIDKAKRTAGTDPMAGFSRAVQWQASDNPALRRNAAVVFGDIGDDVSLHYLEKLSKDRESFVSGEAKRALENWKKHSINH